MQYFGVVDNPQFDFLFYHIFGGLMSHKVGLLHDTFCFHLFFACCALHALTICF